jgi:hypothetical protein
MINPDFELRGSYTNDINSSILDGYLVFRSKIPKSLPHWCRPVNNCWGFRSDFVRHFRFNGQGSKIPFASATDVDFPGVPTVWLIIDSVKF